MEEYGVPESWTRKFVIPMEWVRRGHFFGCTNNGELLIKNATGLQLTQRVKIRTFLQLKMLNGWLSQLIQWRAWFYLMGIERVRERRRGRRRTQMFAPWMT
ncbi:hypothetical protein ACB092_07G189400 [Castanea dentata]